MFKFQVNIGTKESPIWETKAGKFGITQWTTRAEARWSTNRKRADMEDSGAKNMEGICWRIIEFTPTIEPLGEMLRRRAAEAQKSRERLHAQLLRDIEENTRKWEKTQQVVSWWVD